MSTTKPEEDLGPADKFEWGPDDLLVMFAPDDKMTQDEVSYTDTGTPPKLCESCDMFVAPNGCSAVDGTISAKGTCNLWTNGLT